MTRLVQVTTIPMTAASFLSGQLGWLRRQGFDVTLVSSPGNELDGIARREGVPSRAVPMTRSISPARDLQSVRKMLRLFHELRPEIVHAHTPKAGLVAMTAAKLVGVPVRIYHLHGLRFETVSGWRRWLLKEAERTTCRFATDLLCVSESLRKAAVSEQLFESGRSTVLHHGSINGLDSVAFDPDTDAPRLRLETRRELGIPQDSKVLGFVGRLVRDKGIVELTAAWQLLRQQFPDLYLLLVGPFESGDPVPVPIRRQLQQDHRVRLTGWSSQTRPYYAAMDLLTLPSHREGMGYALLEAAAMRLPTVTSRVTGCVDAVVDSQTGMTVGRGNPIGLAQAVRRYLGDPDLMQRHGMAGRQRVIRDFQPTDVWQATCRHYERLLTGAALARPATVRAAA